MQNVSLHFLFLQVKFKLQKWSFKFNGNVFGTELFSVFDLLVQDQKVSLINRPNLSSLDTVTCKKCNSK